MNKKVKFTTNPSIKRKDYIKHNEYMFDKKTNVVPNKRNRLLCVVFTENRGCSFFYHDPKLNANSDYDSFRFRKGLYIVDNEAIHISDNGARVAFYLEGISTPIKMSNIDKETKTVEYLDLTGEKRKSVITKIKGLKFDAKILDTFANRRFSELFTVVKPDKAIMLLFIFSIAITVLSAVNILVSYFVH